MASKVSKNSLWGYLAEEVEAGGFGLDNKLFAWVESWCSLRGSVVSDPKPIACDSVLKYASPAYVRGVLQATINPGNMMATWFRYSGPLSKHVTSVLSGWMALGINVYTGVKLD